MPGQTEGSEHAALAELPPAHQTQDREQEDCPEEGDDALPHETRCRGVAVGDGVEHKAAEKGSDQPDDDVTEEPVSMTVDDPAGKNTGYQPDKDPGKHMTSIHLLHSRSAWSGRLLGCQSCRCAPPWHPSLGVPGTNQFCVHSL